MPRLCELLGSRSDVMYECMYTKHKTQKRKIWQDGFIVLDASRKLVVYADDDGKAGKSIDEAKYILTDWNHKNEEYFETSKFLVEIVNESPISSIRSSQTSHSAGANCYSAEVANSVDLTAANDAQVCVRPSAKLGDRSRLSSSKFRSPLSCGSSRSSKPEVSTRAGHPYSQTMAASPLTVMVNPLFDFDRNPTSEWKYVSNAICRSPDEVLALLEK